ncbi:MAG: AEC family transporter [Rhodospirillales bacterium]
MNAVINAALPLFAIIFAGYLCGRAKLLGAQSSEAINRFVYLVALPVMLFHVLASADPKEILNGPYILGYGGAQVVLYTLTWIIARRAGRMDSSAAGVFALGGVFGNTGYVGIPLAAAAFGPVGAQAAIVATVFQSALFLPLTAVLVDSSGGGGRGRARAIAMTVAKNPIVMSAAAGLAWAFGGLDMPAPVESFLKLLGAPAGPCALFAIGLVLSTLKIRSTGPQPWANVAVKLFVHPALTAAAVFLIVPVQSDWAVVAVLMAALPAGANFFVIARQGGVGVEMASAATMLGTVLSVATVSALLFYFG